MSTTPIIAQQWIEELRETLRPVEERLRQHPYIAAVEAGTLSAVALRRFAIEQYAIIESDLRSVALLVSRFGEDELVRDFFLDVLAGERAALEALGALGSAVGLERADFDADDLLPGAHAYTAYMAWLGAYGSEAEVAAAYLINFPAWGANCARLSRALRERYGFEPEAVAFFDRFANPSDVFESQALAVIQTGIDRGVSLRRVRRSARLLQGYELMYWDTLWNAARSEGKTE